MNTSRFLGLGIIGTTLLFSACTPEPAAPEAVVPEQPTKMSMTFEEMFALDTSYTCDLTQGEEGSRTTGKIYVKDDTSMRIDFASTVNGQDTESHMIRTDGKMYVWMSDQKNGVLLSEEDLFDNPAVEEGFGMDMKNDVELNCLSWTPDDTLLTVPTGYIFIDFNEQMKAVMQQLGGNAKKSQCDSCAKMPAGAGKDACVKSFSC